jgi:late competence protein required for DNA uptake (superfamily II DNA/RNA helicase)
MLMVTDQNMLMYVRTAISDLNGLRRARNDVGKNEPEKEAVLMKDLYHCTTCGWLSTHRPSYEMRDGKLYCKSCIEEFDAEKTRAEAE